MNTLPNTYFYDWFTSDFLKLELDRLFQLFAPLYYPYLPDIDVRVVEESKNGEAAKALFDEGVIEIYSDYHTRHPEEYKVTLLHEAGHFVFCRDHSKFEEYFNYLKFRQQFIEEDIIPPSYSDFLYCRVVEKNSYTFRCSGCKKTSIASSFKEAYCFKCSRTALLVSGL